MTAVAEAQNRDWAWSGQHAGAGTSGNARLPPGPVPGGQCPGNSVVVATDGTAASLRAVDWAAAEARRRSAVLRIIAVPALPPMAAHQRAILDPPTGVADAVWSNFRQSLETAAARAAAQCPGLPVSITLMIGQPGPALAEGVQNACLLVIGTPSARSATARAPYSVSDYVARHALVPVIVVRGTLDAQGEIVAGVLGADHRPALAFAAAEAVSRGARLRVLHIGSGEPQLATLLAGWQLRYPSLAITQETVTGAAGRALVRASAHADLVVAGQGGAQLGLRTGGTGPVVPELMRYAHCPVAVIPAGGQAG